MKVEASVGVLVIAHGSRDTRWVKEIEEAVEQLALEVPISIGYLELVEGKSIPEAVRSLERQGATVIIAVPLFICSGSTHLEEIKYSLGVTSHCRIETSLEKIHPAAEIIWCDAMDDHPLMIEILLERVKELSEEPAKEVVMLVAHGSEKPGFHHLWEFTLKQMTHAVKSRFPFHDVIYGTLHPDTVAEQAQLIVSAHKKLLVVPVFLSEGYFTKKVIPQKLAGIDFQWSGRTFLPHPFVTKWVEERVRSALLRLEGVDHR
ncbi:sirohydrochlorin ferrochelatase [Evansella vedderi]|uniref:Sirohydrochlorin ferrochelatase n=1 Tax=Evansella vedderi TaxID=38282 RepID=A0ABT9ZZE5_9BACI|nr:CbiX/SirB N-terminal domain-containing protein [Evansella vedderi]MDQ0256611.1 sirohydrochlorin ferrochelatase [Evansella vedderi]